MKKLSDCSLDHLNKLQKAIDLILVAGGEQHPSELEYFIVDDYAGGNVDDAYSLGFDAGYFNAAKELKAALA